MACEYCFEGQTNCPVCGAAADPTPPRLPDNTLSDRYRADNSGWHLVSKRTGLSIQIRLSEWFKAEYVEQLEAELTAARLAQEAERRAEDWHTQADRDKQQLDQILEALVGAGDRSQGVVLRVISELRAAESRLTEAHQQREDWRHAAATAEVALMDARRAVLLLETAVTAADARAEEARKRHKELADSVRDLIDNGIVTDCPELEALL